jgi:AcrR family transcriptional regulator
MAERGIRAVGLKEISVAAGQRNNSAAQYYFGDRAGLVEAVFVNRMAPVNATRQRLLDEQPLTAEAWGVRSLVEIEVGPLLAVIAIDGPSWFARFLAQAFADDEYRSLLDLHHEINRPTRMMMQLLERELNELPARVRRHRLDFASIMIVNVLAAYERAGRARGGPWPYRTQSVLAEITDAVVGSLCAPVSQEAVAGRSSANAAASLLRT